MEAHKNGSSRSTTQDLTTTFFRDIQTTHKMRRNQFLENFLTEKNLARVPRFPTAKTGKRDLVEFWDPFTQRSTAIFKQFTRKWSRSTHRVKKTESYFRPLKSWNMLWSQISNSRKKVTFSTNLMQIFPAIFLFMLMDFLPPKRFSFTFVKCVWKSRERGIVNFVWMWFLFY